MASIGAGRAREHENVWRGVVWAKSESTRRVGIFGFAVGWLIVCLGLANQIGSPIHAFAAQSALLFGAASGLTFAFGLRPANGLLYGASGGMACVALAGRAISLIWGANLSDDPDLLWIVALQVTLNVMMIVILWWFWQVEIKPWHVYHLTKKQLSTETG